MRSGSINDALRLFPDLRFFFQSELFQMRSTCLVLGYLRAGKICQDSGLLSWNLVKFSGQLLDLANQVLSEQVVLVGV